MVLNEISFVNKDIQMNILRYVNNNICEYHFTKNTHFVICNKHL